MFAKRKIILVGLVAIAFFSLASVSYAEKASRSIIQRITVKYATGFSIEYLPSGCKKVTDGEGQELLLVPRGKKVPPGYEDLPKINIPVKRVICLSTTEVCCLRALGVLDSVVAVSTKKDKWYIDKIKRMMEEGKIKFVGSTGMGEPNYEEVVSLKPDVVFTYTGYSKALQSFNKLRELDIPVAVDNEWMENHPLGRLEWVKFLAAFYNKEGEANTFFDRVEGKTKDIFTRVSQEEKKPSVLWGSIFAGKCYVPANDSYVAKEIALAGGDYLFTNLKGTGSAIITPEELYAKGKKADIFIYSSWPPYIKSVKQIVKANPNLADIKPIREGKVWCFQPWYYQSIDKTDDIVEDLAALFYPSLFAEHKLKYFQKLPEE